jgi:hypothetical protein
MYLKSFRLTRALLYLPLCIIKHCHMKVNGVEYYFIRFKFDEFGSWDCSALLPRRFGSSETTLYQLTRILTYSMEQSPSWEANRFSASQEISHILWKPKVPYRIYKFSSPVPIHRLR